MTVAAIHDSRSVTDTRELRLSAWSSHEVKVVIRGRYSGLRRLYADIAWNDARASVLRDIEIDDESSWYNFWSGTTLHSASFPSLGESERPLADNVAARSQSATILPVKKAD